MYYYRYACIIVWRWRQRLRRCSTMHFPSSDSVMFFPSLLFFTVPFSVAFPSSFRGGRALHGGHQSRAAKKRGARVSVPRVEPIRYSVSVCWMRRAPYTGVSWFRRSRRFSPSVATAYYIRTLSDRTRQIVQRSTDNNYYTESSES